MGGMDGIQVSFGIGAIPFTMMGGVSVFIYSVCVCVCGCEGGVHILYVCVCGGGGGLLIHHLFTRTHLVCFFTAANISNV